jgi:hypothetical protein
MARTTPAKPPLPGVAHLWRSESYGYRTPGSGSNIFRGGIPSYPVGVGGGTARAHTDSLAPDKDDREILQVCLATISAAAGLIHLAAALSHFGVSPFHAAFFIGTGLVQLAAATLLVSRPDSWVFAATASGNTLILGIWVMSRTIGIPLEPESWTPEPVGIADAVATVLELALVIGTLVLLAPSTRFSLPSSSAELRRWLVPAASVLVVITGPALFFTAGTGHSHDAAAHEATEIHGHADTYLVGGKAMAGAAVRAGSSPLPAARTEPLSESTVPTKPVPVVQPPPAVVHPPVADPHEGEEHQGDE